jgi:hypothetical protein
MASPGPKRLVPPRPPADFADIAIELVTPRQQQWYRVSRSKYRSPLFFSRHGLFRFDSDTGKWGVCYVAQDITTSLMEVFADRMRVGRVDFNDLADQQVWRITTGKLNVMELAGTTLPKIKATLQCFVSRYTLSQEWGRAFMEHPSDMDGVIYTGRQSGRECIALFGDTEPNKGRPFQRNLAAVSLGKLTDWDGLYPLLAKTGARVIGLPDKPSARTWRQYIGPTSRPALKLNLVLAAD